MRVRLRHAAFVAVAAVAFAGFATTPAQASHSWNGYHWARSGETHLTIYSSVTSSWSGNLGTANSDWNQSAYLQNTVVASDTSTTARRNCSSPSGAIRVCDYTYGNNGWAGLASINLVGGTKHISTGTAKMNDTYEASSGAAERQGVMCQEVGHTFGLAHQDENFNNANLGTCMDYTSNWSTNQHPNTHDYNQLATLYNHTDSAAAAAESAGVTTIRTGDTVTIITWAS